MCWRSQFAGRRAGVGLQVYTRLQRHTQLYQVELTKNTALCVFLVWQEIGLADRYTSFAEFYPFYLTEHSNRICRRLHFVGTLLVMVTLLYSLISGRFMLLLVMPVLGYGFAWTGHFFFEKNRPATFTYPLYSLAGDFVMFKDLLIGKIRF